MSEQEEKDFEKELLELCEELLRARLAQGNRYAKLLEIINGIWEIEYGASFEKFSEKIISKEYDLGDVNQLIQNYKHVKEIVTFCYENMYKPIFDKGYKKAKLEKIEALEK